MASYDSNWMIQFGENGAINMGAYIGTLATEYYLLKKNNQNTERTLNELYYAMKAHERLDRKAEKMLPSNGDCDFNGFFVRDDIGLPFVKEFITKKYPNYYSEIESANGFEYKDYWKYFGSFYLETMKNFDNNNDGRVDDYTYTRYNSMDNLAYMLPGFALVKKYVGDDARCILDPSYNFKQNAIDYTDKMFTWMANGGWQIKLPNTDPPQYVVSKDKGGDGRALQYGYAKAAKWITGKDYAQVDYGTRTACAQAVAEGIQTTNLYSNKFFIRIIEEATVPFGLIGTALQLTGCLFIPDISVWQLAQKYCEIAPAIFYSGINVTIPSVNIFGFDTKPIAIDYNNNLDFGITIASSVAAIGDSWEDEAIIKIPQKIPLVWIGPVVVEYQTIYIEHKYRYNSTFKVLKNISDGNNHQFLPLLYYALHHDEKTINSNQMQSTITNAYNRLLEANCNGAYHITGGTNNNSWNCPSVFEKFIESRKKVSGTAIIGDNIKGEEFSGLDYMLLSNLYKIAVGDGLYDYKNAVDNYNYYIPVLPTSDINFRAIETIKSTATFEAHSAIEYVAQEQIEFLPGFEAKYGSNVSASVKTLECTADKKLMKVAGNFTDMEYDVSPEIQHLIDSLSLYEHTVIVQQPNPDTIASTTPSPIQTPSVTPSNIKQLKQDIELYPNPVEDILRINLPYTFEKSTLIHIINAQGNIVEKYELLYECTDSTYSINIKHLPSGIYNIQFINYQTVNKKLIKK
jgi:hypothetical protein